MRPAANGVRSMRRLILAIGLLLASRAWAFDDLALPKVEFSAVAVHDAGAVETRETIHYAHGKLRIDRANGFTSTILDLTTQTQCLLMANHTYLILPMDDELYRRYIARRADLSGARRVGAERVEGMETTKYAFGEDGALDAAGSYWLTKDGVMVRREYEAGTFGQNVHHLEFLTKLTLEAQPATLFSVPAGYTRAR